MMYPAQLSLMVVPISTICSVGDEMITLIVGGCGFSSGSCGGGRGAKDGIKCVLNIVPTKKLR